MSARIPLKLQRVRHRDLLFSALWFLERNDLPGSWRFRRRLESLEFSARKDLPIACSTEHGVDIVIEPFADKGVERSIFRTGSYERGTLSVMSKVLKPGDRFMDIGANVGLMSLTAARLVGPQGRVDAFEPLPEMRRLLAWSLELNGFDHLFVHPVALGSAPARLIMHRHLEVNRGSASLVWESPAADTIEVAVDTLDGIDPTLSDRAITMMKIDVEGWELEALRGARNTLGAQAPVVCVEFSTLRQTQGGQPCDMLEFFNSLGYIPFRLGGSKSKPSPLVPLDLARLPEHDNLFFFAARRIGEYPASLFAADSA